MLCRKGRFWLIAAVVIMLAAPAWSDDEEEFISSFHLFGTTATYLEFNNQEDGHDDDYRKFRQMANFNLAWDKFSLGAEVQYLYYSDEELADPLDLDRLHDTWELRKYYLDFDGDVLSARLGTFFSSFGHGMTLYVQKNETLKLDEPIHGLTAAATLGRFDMVVLGGKVTEPLLENQYNRTFKDEIWGARVLARLPKDFYIAGSYVGAKLDRFFPEGEDDVEVYSIEGGVDGVAGYFDVALEWAEMDRTESTLEKEGYGRYVSVTSYFGPVTILAEYKDYFDFRYRYNLAPNAGRNVEAYDHDDVRGPRLLVDWDIAAIGMLIYASYGDFDTHREPTSPGGVFGDGSKEWYVGLEETLGRTYIEASYFDRDWTQRHIEEQHVMADFHVTVGDRGEAIIGYDKRLEKASYFSLATHRAFLAYSLSPWGTVSLRHASEERSGFDTERFWGGEVVINFKSTLSWTLFAGGDPGGLVCAGGQCREEPRFNGYKTTLIWRF